MLSQIKQRAPLLGITRVYRRLQGFTGDHKGSQGITRVYWDYQDIKWIRMVYRVLQEFVRDCKRLVGLQGYKETTRGYKGCRILQKETRVTVDYKGLQRISRV